MTEIPSASCLASWLGDKRPEFACVLVARIALRVAPILRNTLRTDDVPRRVRIVLSCFRALAAASFAGAWPGRIADIRQAARSAAAMRVMRCRKRTMRPSNNIAVTECQIGLRYSSSDSTLNPFSEAETDETMLERE